MSTDALKTFPPLANPADASLVAREQQRMADLLAYARVFARKGLEPEGNWNPDQMGEYIREVRYLLDEVLTRAARLVHEERDSEDFKPRGELRGLLDRAVTLARMAGI